MRKGEKGILIAIAVIVLVFMGINAYRQAQVKGPDKGIPFYTTASEGLKEKGSHLVKQYDCRDCHTLWAMRNPIQHVPSPALDGIGMLRSESWLFDYLSAKDPQKIIPSRLKAEYRMPSYAEMPEEDRHTLAAYLASLKVKNWYLDEVKKSEYEKLTGKTLPDGKNE
jgi:sulfur-oxidizing protein SoxX